MRSAQRLYTAVADQAAAPAFLQGEASGLPGAQLAPLRQELHTPSGALGPQRRLGMLRFGHVLLAGCIKQCMCTACMAGAPSGCLLRR